MHRRTWLRAAAISAVMGPAWLKRAFADATVKPCEKPGQPATLELPTRADGDFAEALARARSSGRPLFVIVVPVDYSRRGNREALVGEWLLSSPDDALAPLATAEVVCATERVMTKAGLRLPAGDLLFVAITRHGEAAATSAPGKHERDHLTRMAARLLPMGDLSPEARAAFSRRAVRLRKDRIPGSAWSYSLGCGSGTPHDAQPTDQPEVIGCGMGGVGPHASRRFLRFYVDNRQG
jgi:hypothetical protein